MHAQKQTAACQSLRNNRDGSAQIEMNKLADRQIRRAATGIHALMAASRMQSEMSWLTNRKETKPDAAAISYLCHTLHIPRCRQNMALSQHSPYAAIPAYLAT